MKRTLKLLITLTLMTAATATATAQEVKAISFNIRYNGVQAQREDGKHIWANRRDAVIKMLENEDADIIGMQEALLDQLSYIDRYFIKKYRRVGVGRDNGLTRGEHNVIYFNAERFQLISQKTRWLSPTPRRVSLGWDAACIRIVTIAHLRHKATGRDLYYFNTHLDHVGDISRRESVELIAKLIAEEVPAGAALLVGGDMNSNVNEPLFDPLRRAGLEVARDIAPRTDYRSTFNAFGKSRGKMIDHFFVRNVEMVRFHTILRSYGVAYLSDHYPIEIIFNL